MEEEEDKQAGGKSSVSTKRSRAAAIHNQSERVIYFNLFHSLFLNMRDL